jgi:hypothetical protein
LSHSKHHDDPDDNEWWTKGRIIILIRHDYGHYLASTPITLTSTAARAPVAPLPLSSRRNFVFHNPNSDAIAQVDLDLDSCLDMSGDDLEDYHDVDRATSSSSSSPSLLSSSLLVPARYDRTPLGLLFMIITSSVKFMLWIWMAPNKKGPVDLDEYESIPIDLDESILLAARWDLLQLQQQQQQQQQQ